MRKLCALILSCLLAFSLAGCNSGGNSTTSLDTPASNSVLPQDVPVMSESEPPQTSPVPDAGNSTLVAYFSRTGTTKGVAETIQAIAGGDLILLEVVSAYPEAYDDVLEQARTELQEDARPALSTTIENMGEYDVIFIGYPIWHGTCPRVILTFLEAYDLSGKIIVPFSTSGSSGISTSMSEIREVCGESTVLDGLSLSGSAASEPEEAVEAWLSGLDLPALSAGHTGTPSASQDNALSLQIGDRNLTATLVENSSTEALKELLTDGPITIDMHDYGNFEKVGELGTALPTNDEQITTEAGDLILYQGKSFVIYYAPNTWNFTRLGKIDGMSATELKDLLGRGNVTVTLSLSQ